MKIVKVDIDKLKFPGYNPRKKLTPEDKVYKKIKGSIEKLNILLTDLKISLKDDFFTTGFNDKEVEKLQKKFKKVEVKDDDFEPVKRIKTMKNIKCPNCKHEWNE